MSHVLPRISVACSLVALALGLVAPVAAAAESDKCPPGSWFCVDAELKIGTDGAVVPVPPVYTPPVVAPPVLPPPPVVIYTPGPAPVYGPPPTPPDHMVMVRPLETREFGLSFRAGYAGIGGDRRSSSSAHSGSMAGIGAAFRYRPTSRFGVELGLDGYGGTDANGYRRSEFASSVVGLIYANSGPTQLYFLGGFGTSWATVMTEGTAYGYTTSYSYVGGIAGIGVEMRIARRIAVHLDLRGFVRTRTDGGKTPEFQADDGRTTNTSGGALFTSGATFYF